MMLDELKRKERSDGYVAQEATRAERQGEQEQGADPPSGQAALPAVEVDPAPDEEIEDLKRELPPRREAYSEEEVREAVGETRLVLELMGSRWADYESVTFLESL